MKKNSTPRSRISLCTLMCVTALQAWAEEKAPAGEPAGVVSENGK